MEIFQAPTEADPIVHPLPIAVGRVQVTVHLHHTIGADPDRAVVDRVIAGLLRVLVPPIVEALIASVAVICREAMEVVTAAMLWEAVRVEITADPVPPEVAVVVPEVWVDRAAAGDGGGKES